MLSSTGADRLQLNQHHQPGRANMQKQQLELWKPKGRELQIPPLYQELTADQRRQIIGRLARLILDQARSNTNTDTDTDIKTDITTAKNREQSKSHER